MLKLPATSVLRRASRPHTSQWYTTTITNTASNACASNLNALIDSVKDAPIEKAKGGLHGRSIAIKDNIVASHAPTTAASRILHQYTSPFEATVVGLLRESGASIISKTNLDEFGMGSHTQNSTDGPVQSPFKRDGISLSPGGSSGGSAVAVATRHCWAALGTDTGGSVRLPAAYTGIVGFKPSYGLVSRWGVIQYANSLDTVGILAQTVADVRSVFQSINRHDSRDPTALSEAARGRLSENLRSVPRKLCIGIPVEYIIKELSSETRSAFGKVLNKLQDDGHNLHAVTLPTTRSALSAYYILAPAEAASNLAKYDGIRYGLRGAMHDAQPGENMPLYAQTRGDGFGAEVQRRILLGAYTLSSNARDNYFRQAQRIRRLVTEDFNRVFATRHILTGPNNSLHGQGKVDVLLTPTAPTLPPTVTDVAKQAPLETYMNDVFTVPASLAGLPSVSVPVELLPADRKSRDNHDMGQIGVQVMGQYGDDDLVLHAASIIEELERQDGNI